MFVGWKKNKYGRVFDGLVKKSEVEIFVNDLEVIVFNMLKLEIKFDKISVVK